MAPAAANTEAYNGRNGVNGVNGHYHPEQPSAAPAQMSPVKASGSKGKRLGANREGVTNAFSQFSQILRASHRPLPTQMGDGTFSVGKRWTGLSTDLGYIRWKDVVTLATMIRSKLKGEQVVDDKTMIMERVIQLVSNLPTKSKTRVTLTNTFLNELWYTLEHPPSMYVGTNFQYRSADGSNNNINMPRLGAAGTTYARSVRPSIPPLGALPDPALIFDSVMKRTKYKKHPNDVSSILWYWATIIIHDLFWTDYRDINKSKTSSYLDLSPLYGSNQEMQDTIRTFQDGKLKPDCFADKRLLGMPPGVGVLLIMFNRFHNQVAENLAAINEGGKFTAPPASLEGERREAAWKKYDNDLFQTARLVTSGMYINITLLDYVRGIVGLNHVDTTWTLDPRQEMGVDAGTAKGAEAGTGNVVSAEFNLCYRWHACISARDEQWVEDFYQELFGKGGEDLTVQDLAMGFAKIEKGIPKDPIQRPWARFKRGPDGRYNDDQLVNAISDSIEDCAGSFGARNVPANMRAVEILGIIQGRQWNLAGLNEFRKHFSLRPYETFEEINPDPEVADQLRHLYQHPDFVELYPGLVAEDHKKPMDPGVGICPTYTISRVVLSDAVCLVRGDRHYTIDYNPHNLTSWGYNEVQYDLNINNGCVFYKLFLRAFPDHFQHNSAYAHFPMCVPSKTKEIVTGWGKVDQFDFSRPTRISQRVHISSYGAAKQVLENQENYRATWTSGLSSLLMGANEPQPTLSSSKKTCSPPHRPGWRTHVQAFYRAVAAELLDTKSYKLAGQRQVDLVRDVGNTAHVHLAARALGLPLKTAANPRGVYTAQELYAVLAVLHVTVFLDVDPVKSFAMRQAACVVVQQLAKLAETNVSSTGSWLGGWGKKEDPLAIYEADIVRGLAKDGTSSGDVAWGQILPMACAMVPEQAGVFAQAVDFYLSPKGAEHRPEMHRIAKMPPTEDSDALLLGYALEGARLAGSFASCREVATAAVLQQDDGSDVTVMPKDRVLVSLASTSRDPTQFPDPETVNPRRPLDKYIFSGAHTSEREAGQVALTELFRALFRRENVRRVAGPQGELKRVPRPGGFEMHLREDWSALWPFPVTMRVAWDE